MKMLLRLLIFATYLSLAMSFWYYFRSIILMGKRSIKSAILGYFFPPIAQLFYYNSNKITMSSHEKRILHRFFLVVSITIFVAAIWYLTFWQ